MNLVDPNPVKVARRKRRYQVSRIRRVVAAKMAADPGRFRSLMAQQFGSFKAFMRHCYTVNGVQPRVPS